MDKKALIVILLTIVCWFIYAQGSGDMAQSVKRGQGVYVTSCQACHQDQGQGMDKIYPPLAESDFLAKNPKRAIDIVLNGMHGKIVVNGQKYNLVMPAQKHLSDQQIADVLNYVRNSWGNSGKQLIAAQVRVER